MRIYTAFLLLLATMGYSSLAHAQTCQNIGFTGFPIPAYVGEFSTYSVMGGFAGSNSVTWQFTSVLGTDVRSSPVTIFGSQGVSSVNYINPIRGQSQVIAQSVVGGCTLFQEVYNLPSATIQSITGTRQNGITLQFTSTIGVDPEFTSNATYNWDFGDGQSAQGRIVNHAYDNNANYTVKLTVSDGNRTSVKSQSISIAQNPSLPGRPGIIRPEFLGCQSTNAEYLFDWIPTGPQPSNVFEFQIKWFHSNYWGPIQRTSNPFKVVNGLSSNTPYNVRVRGCINNNSSTCGPYRTKTMRTAICTTGGGGGGFIN